MSGSKYAIIIGLTLLLMGSFWGYRYYFDDFEVRTDPANPDSYPFVSWQAVVDGRLARSLSHQAGKGMLPSFGNEVVPILTFARVFPEYRENEGIDLVEIESSIVRSPLYAEVNKRPFITVAYYQTKIGDEKYYLMMQRWRSVDGSESYVPLILPEKKVLENGGMTKYYGQLTANNTEYMYSPIMYWATRDYCVANMGGMSEYCDWWFGGSGRMGKYEELLTRWVESAVVPREVGRYPAAVRVTPLFRSEP